MYVFEKEVTVYSLFLKVKNSVLIGRGKKNAGKDFNPQNPVQVA